jgi:hypothetical protein
MDERQEKTMRMVFPHPYKFTLPMKVRLERFRYPPAFP